MADLWLKGLTRVLGLVGDELPGEDPAVSPSSEPIPALDDEAAEAVQRELSRARKHVSSLERQVDDARQELANAESDRGETRLALDRARAELDELRSRAGKGEADRHVASEKAAAAQQSVVLAKAERRSAEERASSTREDLGEARAEIKALVESLDAAREELGEARASASTLRENSKTSAADSATDRAARLELESQLSGAIGRVGDLTLQLGRARRDLASARRRAEGGQDLAAELDELRTARDTAEAQTLAMEQESRIAERDLATAQRAASELEAQLTQARQRAEAAEARLGSQLKETEERFRKQVEDAEELHRGRLSHEEQRRKTLEADLAATQASLVELRTAVEDSKAMAHALDLSQRTIADLEAVIARSEELWSQSDATGEETLSYEDDVSELRHKLKRERTVSLDLRSEMASLEEKNEAGSSSIAELEAQLQASADRMDLLAAEADERISEIRANEAQLDKLRHALQDREASLQALGELRLSLQWQVTELTRERAHALARASQMETLAEGAGREAEATAEDRDLLREQLSEVETARQDLDAQLADTRHALRSAQSSAAEVDPLRAKIQDLQAHLAAERTRATASHQKAEQVREENAAAIAARTRVETTLSEAQAAISTLTVGRDKALRDVALAREETDALKEVLTARDKASRDAQTHVSREPVVPPAEVTALRNRLAQLEEDLASAQRSSRHYAASSSASEAHAEEAENRASQLEQRLTELEDRIPQEDLQPAERDRRQLEDLRRRFPAQGLSTGGRPADTSPAAHQAIAWVTPPSQRARIPLGSQSRGGLGRGLPPRRVAPPSSQGMTKAAPSGSSVPSQPSEAQPPVAAKGSSLSAPPNQPMATTDPPGITTKPPPPPRELRKAFDASTGVYSARKTDDKNEGKGLFGRFKRRR